MSEGSDLNLRQTEPTQHLTRSVVIEGGRRGRFNPPTDFDRLVSPMSIGGDRLCSNPQIFRPSYGPAIQPNATACFSFARRTPPIFMYTTRPRTILEFWDSQILLRFSLEEVNLSECTTLDSFCFISNTQYKKTEPLLIKQNECTKIYQNIWREIMPVLYTVAL